MISLKGVGDRIRTEEQARKLPLARIIASGPPAGSGITLAAWRSSHECEFFACPRHGTTCADRKCKIGSACLAMLEIGLGGTAERFDVGSARNVVLGIGKVNPALFVSRPESLAVGFMAG